MSPVETWTLRIHVAAGVVALIAGFGALVTIKGGRRHRLAGTGFLLAMSGVVATVIALLAIDPTASRGILTLVAIFSGYLAFSGFRALSRSRERNGVRAVDWVAAGGVLLACLSLGAWGGTRMLDGRNFGIVLVAFGTIGVAFGLLDVRSFRSERGEERLVSHLQRMTGAFIATVSAVSAVTLAPALGIAAWLWPTILGVPLIAYWSRAYATD
ncbi:hypothetical protein [Halovivax limisalsi]|uniref:hypothetical protein n=1 Tax=Halovivax limisalsi TaxID=1453760 RepID=UPI001FFC4911|nr:hypothetical protein [Halovivax limisalsi]